MICSLIEWNDLVLYPAGYFARANPGEVNLDVARRLAVRLRARNGFNRACAARSFKRVTLETLIDSPVYAGRYAAKLDLDPGAAAPVHLDLFADRPELLDIKPEQARGLPHAGAAGLQALRVAPLCALRLPVLTERPGSAARTRASSIERRRHRSGFLHRVGQGRLRQRLAAARVHALVERQIPPPGGSLDPELQRADAEQPALGL